MSKTYVTKSGDMFDNIAYEQLGSCSYVERLINANRKYIDVYIFDSGVELILPDIEAEKKARKLPPWRLSDR
ncbi:MAG: tail protein X [Selenomonadaceae bacterium]|nr:tail protein X [Selenomonadaceae bacterium]